ncbi:MAG: polyhydroxyalkanoate synthesis repressor PhaR [Burkholderiaceae bacterium]
MVQPRRAAPAAAKAAASSSATEPSAKARAAASLPQRVLKKYPNRRLYDTQTSSYITLTDVKAMVLATQDFVVVDAKTNEDLTRSILLQIILEEESGGLPMFSSQALAQIIRFYGHSMQGMMGTYLEKNLQTFTDIQAKLAEQSKGLYDPRAMSPDLWSQFLQGQAPGMQSVMGSYLEQSKTMFTQMQEQMAKQAGTLFPGMPGFKAPKKG